MLDNIIFDLFKEAFNSGHALVIALIEVNFCFSSGFVYYKALIKQFLVKYSKDLLINSRMDKITDCSLSGFAMRILPINVSIDHYWDSVFRLSSFLNNGGKYVSEDRNSENTQSLKKDLLDTKRCISIKLINIYRKYATKRLFETLEFDDSSCSSDLRHGPLL